MDFSRRALCGLGLALALIATPALAGWKNFGLNSPGGFSHPSPHIGDVEDDPIEVPDLTEIDTDPTSPNLVVEMPDFGNDPFPPATLPLVDSPSQDGQQTTQVPEPTTISLLALALLGLGWKGRRSRAI